MCPRRQRFQGLALMRALACVLLCATAVGACREDAPAPQRRPASLDVVTDLPATGLAGQAAPAFEVRVTDANGRPLPGVLVNFAAVVGSPRLDAVRDTTDDEGIALTTVTLSTTPGPNQIEARVGGVRHVRSTSSVGSAGQARAFSFSPRRLWFQPTTDDRAASAIARDEYGNAVGGPVTWTSRDPALIAVEATTATTAQVRVVGRPGQTYLVATHGGAIDSIHVAVHDTPSSPCDFLASPVALPVGGSLPFEASGLTCVTANDAAEYIVVGHYNSPLALASAGVGVVAHGTAAPRGGGAALAPAAGASQSFDSRFETDLRSRERAGIPPYLAAARAWYAVRSTMPAIAAVARVGDHVSVNVNAFEFCTQPAQRTARVAALTSGTMILEDTSNPPGGFTDEEYATIASTVDTLVLPVNTAAFGEPTDIDRNGRIAILFTRAVNELTPRGSGGVVLGFYYSRDLLPRSGVTGECPGSNVAEIFYIMVPDPDAVLGDARTKGYVQGIAISTIAHELQHLINASRRMYVTRTPETVEETWLNEGLSHIAEELVFYRASGLGPRQNIGADQLAPGTHTRDMHELFMRANFARYALFLDGTHLNSPMAANDLLATRGASWALLRYVADRAGAVDGDLWRRLVDGKNTGAANLDDALMGTGITAAGALKDWSSAVAVDDLDAAVDPALSQPSWQFSTSMAILGYRTAPASFVLADGQPLSFQVRAGGSIYFAFGVDAGREALVQISSGGGVAQPGMRLTLVRIR
jgi:hypothetical protein